MKNFEQFCIEDGSEFKGGRMTLSSSVNTLDIIDNWRDELADTARSLEGTVVVEPISTPIPDPITSNHQPVLNFFNYLVDEVEDFFISLF